ncbi:MAG: hypothetical protein GEV10_20345 [Streptosporangiales bacterium]|nr:hypothetical protein [Streptosporangiales bacterium]
MGWLLLAPALVLWLAALVAPVLYTAYLSLQQTGNIRDLSRTEFVGLDNYTALSGVDALPGSIGFTLAVVLVRVAAVAVVPPALAWGVATLGRRAAIPVGVAFAVPLAFATPAMAAAGRVSAAPTGSLATEAGARLAVLGFDATHALLYGCALGLVVLVGALRQDPASLTPRRSYRAFAIAWLVGIIAAAAYGLQAFTEMQLMTGGGPRDATSTLGLLAIRSAVVNFQLGYAAAFSVVILVPVLLLGLGTGFLVVATRVRVDIDAPVERWTARTTPLSIAAIVAGGVALVVALFALVEGVLPVVAGWTGQPPPEQAVVSSLGRLLTHDLVTTFLVVAVSLAAAVGIVLCRPLGRGSEWMLLAFAPWLFLTNVPLAVNLLITNTSGLQRPLAYLQPALSLMPALIFAFAVILRGLEPRWRVGRARGESLPLGPHVMVPLVPMIAAIGLAAFVATAHELVTPYTTVIRPDESSLVLIAVRQAVQMSGEQQALTLADLPMATVSFLGLAAAFVWYAGRIVVRAGADPDLPTTIPVTREVPGPGAAPR